MTDGALGRVLLTLRGVQWILGTKGDPYALLLRATGDDRAETGRRVRARGSLYWSSAEAWVTADHAVVRAALADRRLTPRPPGTAAPGGGSHGGPDGEPAPWDVPALREALPLAELPAALDREEYERLRLRAGPVLGERALRPWHAAALRAYRNRASAVGERFDLVDDVIRPATVEAARTLIGVPGHRAARFAELSAQTAGVLDATLCPPRLDTARRYRAALPELHALLAETIADAAAPGASGTSGANGGTVRTGHGRARRLADLPAPGDPAATADALTVSALLALVGVEAATTLIADATALLLDHPDQWRALRRDPGLAPAVVAETLRYAPPVRLHRLYARQDLDVAGTPVAAGEEVVLLVGAAHRDPRRHRDPDRFDIHRTDRDRGPLPDDGHLGGLVGAASRLAADAALRALAADLPELVRTGAVLRRLRSPITGGVLRFPVARQGNVRR